MSKIVKISLQNSTYFLHVAECLPTEASGTCKGTFRTPCIYISKFSAFSKCLKQERKTSANDFGLDFL